MVDKNKQHPFADKDGKLDILKFDSWIADNIFWLTEWLTNVVMVSKKEMDKSTATFQTFQAQITSQPPLGVIEAGCAIKLLMMHQCITGKASLNPPQFKGFYQTAGRLPKEGDLILFTAIKWFQLEHIQTSSIILAENSSIQKIPMLTTTCGVNYITQR